ncbi:Maf family protein [Rhodohalobacter sp. 8-1]|uniref:Maf family protein n=1 Tax=Rhodohalobacter sp. 8-1 TaxID=3131972 RepID=UPI0030EC8DE3
MSSIILASASPRRKTLFNMMGVSCTVDPSTIEEIINENLSPGKNVCSLAEQKAADVAQRRMNTIVIAADTIVVKDGAIMVKPETSAQAFEMLRSLSGRHHWVYSGVSVMGVDIDGSIRQSVAFFEKTKVTFSTLEDTEINRYIATGSPMDKAGAYGIQDDYGSLFIKKIEGDYYNVVGFPVNKFYQTLKSDYPAMFKEVFNL